MAQPRHDLAEFSESFISDGSGQSLVIEHDNRRIAPWRITFLSTGTYVLNYATKGHPTDAAGRQASIDALPGIVSFGPAIEIDSSTASGLKLACDY